MRRPLCCCVACATTAFLWCYSFARNRLFGGVVLVCAWRKAELPFFSRSKFLLRVHINLQHIHSSRGRATKQPKAQRFCKQSYSTP